MYALQQFISILIGFAVVGYALYVAGAGNASSEVLYNLYHVPSLQFVSLVLLGVYLASYGFRGVYLGIKSLFSFGDGLRRKNRNFSKYARQMAEAFYRGEFFSGKIGVGSLGDFPKVWRKTYMNLARKIPVTDVIKIVENDAEREIEDLNYSIKIFKNMAALSSSVGVLGTIIGLIKLFKNLTDYSSMGSNMALAFMTTLYGIVYSIVFFMPVAIKLERQREEIKNSYNDVIHWLTVVEGRKPTSYLDSKNR